MKIRQIIVFLFVFLSAIPMTLLGITNMNYYNHRLESVLENDLQNSVTIQIKAIDNFLQERMSDADVLVRYQLIHQLLAPSEENDPQVIAYISKYSNDMLSLKADSSPFIESATILDLDFTVVACSDSSSVGQVSSLKDLDPKYLTRDFQFTPVIQTQREGSLNRIIAGIQTIYNGSRKSGYLVMELNLEFFEELRTSAKLYNNGTIYLIDGNNAMIAAGDTLSARETYVLNEKERSDYSRAWSERSPEDTECFLHYQAQGDHYVSYYAEIPDTDWRIISSVNIDEVLQTQKAAVQLTIFILGVLAVLLLAVNHFIYRYLGAPIHHMISKFSQIDQNQNFSIRMDQEGCREIRIIGESINTLLDGMESFVMKEQQARNTLKYKAERDPLTGLYNREVFGKLLEEEILRSTEAGSRIACLYLDIDDFKEFNTEYGHAGGDTVLRFIADTLQSQIGETCCRIGGDEFIACISDASNALALENTVQRLISILNHGVRFNGRELKIPVYCSIGVIFSNPDAKSGDELIEGADKIMYQVKNDHKNGYRIVYR